MAGTQQQNQGRRQEPSSQTRHGAAAVLAWAASHRAISAVAVAVVFVALPLMGLLFLGGHSPEDEGPVTCEMALAALDNGDWQEARRLAERLRDADALSAGEEGCTPYVLGVVASRDADQLSDPARAQQSLLAARYLEDARDLGFPPKRQSTGIWLLGKNLFRAGQFDACLEPLVAALKANPESATEIHRMLAQAYTSAAKPDYAKALEHNQLYLADEDLTTEERARGWLSRAEFSYGQGDFEACRASLKEIPAGSAEHAEAIVLEGRVLLAEASALKSAEPTLEPTPAARQKLEAAIETFRRALATGSSHEQVAGKAMYLIGVCYEALGDDRAAHEQFNRVLAAYASTPEGFAAAVHQTDQLRRLGEPAEAYEALRRKLATFKGPEAYQNPWLSLEELRDRSLATYRQALEGEYFQQALELTSVFSPLFPRPRAVQLTAECHRAWARALMAQAKKLPASEAVPLAATADAHFQQAGQGFRELARLRFATREYPDDLWESADCFLTGHDYASAAEVLTTYLGDEPFRRRSEALLRLGEALVVLGKLDEAVDRFQQSINADPKNAATYRARVLASKAYLEKNEAATAEQLLLENLQSDLLTPESLEWRQSLFDLGRLLHVEGRYSEAVERLEEAVKRYPDAEPALESRYLIADSYRRLAKDVQARMDEAVVESARIGHRKELQRLLEAAIGYFDEAVSLVQTKQQSGAELSDVEQTVLKNCLFMKGAALFDMGRYEDAIRAWSTVTNRYQHEPEVLNAYVQIADGYRRLNRPLDAKATIEQAKVVLSRIPDDAPFAPMTNLDRQDWARHLEWLGSL